MLAVGFVCKLRHCCQHCCVAFCLAGALAEHYLFVNLMRYMVVQLVVLASRMAATVSQVQVSGKINSLWTGVA